MLQEEGAAGEMMKREIAQERTTSVVVTTWRHIHAKLKPICFPSLISHQPPGLVYSVIAGGAGPQ
jgi:hypothetical protein